MEALLTSAYQALNDLGGGTAQSGKRPSGARVCKHSDGPAPPVHELREALRPLAAPPAGARCSELSGVFSAVLAARDAIGRCGGELLFGAPSGARHARLQLRWSPSAGGGAALAEVAGVEDDGLSGLPAALSADRLAPCTGSVTLFGDVWLDMLHEKVDADTSRLSTNWALACGPEAPEEVIRRIWRALSEPLGWLASGAVAPAQLGCALRIVCPNLMGFLRRFADLQTISLDATPLDEHTAAFLLKAPLNLDLVEKHYERLAALLRHFELLSVSVARPNGPAVLAGLVLREGHVEATFCVRNGQLAWDTGEEFALLEDGTFECTADVESNVRLLGPTLGAVAMPPLRFLIRGGPGRVRVTCASAGEGGAVCAGGGGAAGGMEDAPAWDGSFADIGNAAWAALEGAAASVFDVRRFQRLLLEQLSFELVHEPCGGQLPGGAGGAWLLRAAGQVAVPTSRVLEVFSQYFQSFVTSQLTRMDLTAVKADLLAALGRDAEALHADGASALPGGGTFL